MEESQLRVELAAAYNLIHHFGWDDLIYTHLTCRIPGTNHILINQYGMMFNEVTASNLLKVDLSGEVIGEGFINPAGYVLHSAIHSHRPDVCCVLHTHTPSGIAVSADKDGLWPISQAAMLIAEKVSYHDYYGLVVNQEEKATIQSDLGMNDYLILRNHGLLTVGKTVANAFMNMYVLQQACDVQVNCIRDRVIEFNPDIIAANRESIQKLDNIVRLPWEALMRIVKRNYPNYKN